MIGKLVTVTVDRPLGSYHPKHKDIYYPINYGYIEGVMAPDGEEQDAYILGVDEAVEKFTGKIIAIVHRHDDVEEKWVVAPEGLTFTKEEIQEQIHFQEQYFDSEIVVKAGNTTEQDLFEKFEFRRIKKDEAEQAVTIEQICFPPNEACSEKNMKERIAAAPELFLVAEDKETGKLAGFLNGIATDEYRFRDEFFTDIGLHDPHGKNIMLLGLDVLPEYRGQGLGRELVAQYLRREQEKGRHEIFLTCLQEKVEMYQKFGFMDRGIANSTWGGEEWHEMSVYCTSDD